MFFPALFGANQHSGDKPPSTGSNPSSWLLAALGGGTRSASGIYVTPETAIGFIAVYACVKLLAESIAQLPCNLYRRVDDNGSRERANDHPVYDLIHNTPNGWQTAFQYREFMQGGLGLRGNAFALVERNAAGEVTAIIPQDPAKVDVKVGSDRRPVFDLRETGETNVPFSQMHHIAAFSTNGYTGLSPISAGREALGLSLAIEKHAGTVFANGTHIKGVLERPYVAGMKSLEEGQVKSLKQQWKTLYSGIDNAGEVAVLQDGIQFKSIAMSNEDAQLLASRVHGIGEVARLYNIPPHMIQLLEHSTNNNIEHQGLQFVIYTLLPWLRRHESAMMRDLLTTDERKAGHYIEFNVSGLMRGDLQTRFTAYAQGRQWGWLSVNDIRRLENLTPVKNGDVYLQPLNMAEAGNPLPIKNPKLQHELDEIKEQAHATA
jgi:HK97 family phage portal protein